MYLSLISSWERAVFSLFPILSGRFVHISHCFHILIPDDTQEYFSPLYQLSNVIASELRLSRFDVHN